MSERNVIYIWGVLRDIGAMNLVSWVWASSRNDDNCESLTYSTLRLRYILMKTNLRQAIWWHFSDGPMQVYRLSVRLSTSSQYNNKLHAKWWRHSDSPSEYRTSRTCKEEGIFFWIRSCRRDTFTFIVNDVSSSQMLNRRYLLSDWSNTEQYSFPPSLHRYASFGFQSQ